jgi:CRISPR/Cas system type I-B associated protein Csh2 (Cas7 group RAMP superfamily)
MRRTWTEAEGEIMRGRDADGIAQTEADHFMKCPACGRWFDLRDLGQVLAHVHDAEIGEGPVPPVRELRFSR